MQLGPVRHPDVAGAGVDDRARARDDRDLSSLQQTLEALGQSVDDLLLAGLARTEIERGLARVDTELLGPGDGAQHLGRLEQLLGGDAAAMEARAPDPLLLDDRDALTHRRAVERGRVPARAATEDDDIELFGQGGHPLGSIPDHFGMLLVMDIRRPRP